jgi:hypothetical protein
MSTLKLYPTTTYGDTPSGVYALTAGHKAYIVLGRVGDQHVCIEAEGPNEITAIERLLQKCKAWSTLMSINMTEALGPAIKRFEAEATDTLTKEMGVMGVFAPATKKSEPS